MRRREFLSLAVGAGVAVLLPPGPALATPDVEQQHPVVGAFWDLRPLVHDPEYWRQHVSAAAWDVLFRERTERAFSSPLDSHYEAGTYVCAACHLPLFPASTKYDSRTGWPSFYQPFSGHLVTRKDSRFFMSRTEYHCIRCGGHQGHVFNDGPDPTGERWCNNGLALRFVPADERLPSLRG
jgi:peptide-methionine (R)-S-oxide reductase